jgi:hypothetical protein
MKMCLPWEDEFDEECGEDYDDDEDGDGGEDYDDDEEEGEGDDTGKDSSDSSDSSDSADYAFQERRASSAETPNQRSYVPWHFGGDGSGCDGI